MGKKPRDGFYKREDGNPYWWTRDPVTGKRCSTGFKDKEAARRWRAARERMAADPAHAAAEAATLGEWCGRFVAWKEKTSSAATVSVARQKLGHWVRVFGEEAPLSRFAEPSAFDDYVNSRRGDGAGDHTISKEVAHMLAVLKLAKCGKFFAGDLSTLRPPDLHAGYEPRTRNLNRHELAALLAELEPDRGAMVAIGVALGVRLGEAQRLLPTDIDWAAGRVYIRGTKTATSRRYVPILSLFRPLLESAASYLPLRPWGKVWRDIQAACKRAGIPPCSTNDFRRTHATLLAEAGVDADHTRRLLGHTTRTLVDRVYGQPSTEALAELVESKLLGAAPLLPEEPPGDSQAHGTTSPLLEPGSSAGPTGLGGTPAGEGVTPAVDREPSGSGAMVTPTAGASPGWAILSTDVTFPYQTPTNGMETSIIPGAPEPTRTADLRFRNPLLAGTHADPAEFSGGSPVGSGGFGQIPTGQLITDVTSNWGAS